MTQEINKTKREEELESLLEKNERRMSILEMAVHNSLLMNNKVEAPVEKEPVKTKEEIIRENNLEIVGHLYFLASSNDYHYHEERTFFIDSIDEDFGYAIVFNLEFLKSTILNENPMFSKVERTKEATYCMAYLVHWPHPDNPSTSEGSRYKFIAESCEGIVKVRNKDELQAFFKGLREKE